MSKTVIVFALWCLVLGAGALAATWYGWLPFANRDSRGGGYTGGHGGHSGYGGGLFFGPSHK